MRWKAVIVSGIISLASILFADTPYLPYNVNIELSEPQFDIRVKALNTPTIRFYIYQGTNAFDSTGYNAYLSWGKDTWAASMVSVTGVVGAINTDFNVTSNSLAYPITRWYCSLMLTKPVDGSVYSISYGYMTVLPAPEVSSTAILQKTFAINGSEYGPFTGNFTNWPFALVGDYGGYVTLTVFNNTTNYLQGQITANSLYTNYAATAYGWGDWATNNYDWDSVTNTPDTVGVGGYGITDVYTKVESDAAFATTGTVEDISADVDVLKGVTNSIVYTNTTAYTDAVAKANSALQSGDNGTWTNLSEYNNDLTGLSTNLSDYNNDTPFMTSTNLSDYNDDVGFLTNEPLWIAASNKVVYTNTTDYIATVTKASTAYGWGDWATNYYDWDRVTNTPDNISDYGITDAYTKVESDATFATTGTVGGISDDVDILKGQTNTYVLTNTPAYTAAVALAGSAVQDGDTIDSLTITNQVLVPEALSDGAAVNRQQLYNYGGSLSVLRLYVSTNLNSFGNPGSLLPAVDDFETIIYTTNTAGAGTFTNLVGTFWMTNSTTLIRHGAYPASMIADRLSGNGSVHGRIELIYTDDGGATTNVIDTSSDTESIIAYTTYLFETAINDDIEDGTNIYLGVRYYQIKTAGSQATVIKTYLGNLAKTHIDTPGIGQFSIGTRGGTGVVENTSITQAVYDSSTRLFTLDVEERLSQYDNDTPFLTAMTFGTTDTMAYRGDWGNNVSGRVVAVEAEVDSLNTNTATFAQGATADTAMQDWVDDTTPIAGGDVGLGGFSLTNAGSITSTNVLTGKSLNLTGGDSGLWLKGDGTEGTPAGAGTMTSIGFGGSNYTTEVQVDAGSNISFRFTSPTNVIIDSPASGITNQIMSVDGTLYTITNNPSSADDVLKFTPANTTAYFAAASGGGSLYPVFELDIGNIEGNWTDFEIKATTNNFTNLLYYYKSWTTNTGINSDTNVFCYFTDDYAADVRQWHKKTNDIPVSAHLISTNSVVDTIYFYPSHDCTWSNWMSEANTHLIWSWVRVDDIGFEMNFSETKQHWNAIQPEAWKEERTMP